MTETDNIRKGMDVSIKICQGDLSPRYPKTSTELVFKSAVITEKGTVQGLPIVDFVMVDNEGKEYYFMTSGRIVQAIASAVGGVNLRISGKENP